MQAGVTFDDVLERYSFDMQLRTLLLQAFSYIEVSIRTQWTYHLSYTCNGGEHSHLNPSLFSDQYAENLEALREDYQQHGQSVHHYDFNDCPVWAVSEVMSLGQLSRWYRSTDLKVRQLVAGHYQLSQKILGSVLRHLVTVRNCCAHHELLWDREFITKFSVPKQMGKFSASRTFFNESDTSKVYNSLAIIAYLTGEITGDTDWTQKLVNLMNQYPNIPQGKMGFIPEWQQLDVWQV